MMTGTSFASTTMLVGNTTIESFADSNPAGNAQAFTYTAAASGNAGSVSVYVDSGTTATTLYAGLYSSSNGHPGTLLASGSKSSPQSSSWNTINFSTRPFVTAGKQYWIAVLSTGSQLNFRDRNVSSGTCTETSPQGNLTGLPSAWSPGVQWSLCSLSAFVSSVATATTAAPSPERPRRAAP
jgi:hypothetical protein